MKILVLSDDFPPNSSGGGGTVAFDLTQQLQKRGHEILVVTTVRTAGEAGETVYEGLRVIRIHTSYQLRYRAYVSLWNRRVVNEVGKIIVEFKPDVVHAHNIHGYLSYGSLKVAKQSGAKVVLTCHDVMTFSYGKLTEFINKKDLSVPTAFNYRLKPLQQLFSYRMRYNPFRNAVIRHILKTYVDKTVAVSHALKQAMNDNGISGVEVIHNAIDAGEWQEKEEDVNSFKKKYSLGDSVVLFGGRLSGIKGGYELIRSLAAVSKTIPDVQLLVVGEKNTYAENMLQLADKAGMRDKVVFTGWLSGRSLHTAYHASSLAVTPSLCFDSFIMVNLEAMACGKPAITTCFGGSKEVVEDGVTGYVINPFDIETMTKKIAELLGEKKKGAQFGQAGRERAVRQFSLEECAKKYERLFSGL